MAQLKFKVPDCIIEGDLRYSSVKGIHVWDKTHLSELTEVNKKSTMKCVLCGVVVDLSVRKEAMK